MLIYKNDGKLFCISKKALKLAGYHDIEHFNDEHNDYSELFVKRPGYIYNFENFSWLNFLRNATEVQKRVLISTKDSATYECELAMETIYPVEFDESTPEFFYQIEFKNLKLADGSAIVEDFEESIPEEPPFANSMTETSFIEESATKLSEPFETPTAEEEKEPFFEKVEERGGFEPNIAFEDSSAVSKPKEEERPLDLVDFEFGSPEEKSEEKKEETPLFSSTDISSAKEELPQTPEIGLKIEDESKSGKERPIFETLEISESIAEKASEEKPSEVTLAAATETEEKSSIQMPDIGKVSATLGLPETMVKAFIKEFITTYLEDRMEVEAALESKNIHVVKKEALKLKGIAANLRMDPLTEVLEKILAAKEEEELKRVWSEIDFYMQKLASLYLPESTSVSYQREEKSEAQADAEPLQKVTPEISAETKSAETTPEISKGLKLEERDTGETIIFDPNEAADALGLPESLILEFVNDFIEQAREEKATFEEAYDKGDIGTINEVAHKLKGVAANLRIEDMRQLMENVQHAKSPQEVEKELIDFYHKLAALTKMMAKEYA